MILFHGSNIAIKKPLVSCGRLNVDFGQGFYTTTIKSQAIKWAARFKESPVISIYDLDFDACKNDCLIKDLRYKDGKVGQ